jgi:hypothetical protein
MTPKLKALADRVESLQDQLEEAESEYETAAEPAIRAAKGIPADHYIQLGTWECSDSPTGRCAYDMTDEDLAGDDECIFCGHPDERK